VATLGACAPEERWVNGQLVTTGRSIINGAPDTDPAHMAVVALTPGPNWSSFCTGTLITPTVVVTAGHCLEGRGAGSFQIFFGNDVQGSGDYRQVSELLIHPDYNGQQVESDIALVRLSSAAPAGISPIPPLPAGSGLTAADEGSTVTFSGFGVTENNTSGEKLTVTSTIGKVCPGPSGCSYSGAWVVARAMGYPNSPGGPCSGDSGGPAFVSRGGVEYLVGVTSYGDPNCSQYGVSTMVHSYESWIQSFTGGASEICGNGVDDDGDGQADCADADCATDPACQGPDACEAAAALGCGDTVNGTTVGGPTDFTTNGCMQSNPEQGPERAYELTVPAGTQLTATLTPTGSGDLDLFLFSAAGSGCDPQSCLESSLNEGNQTESFTLNAPADGAYLVVETWDTASPFTLQVTCQGAVEDCDNGTDDDGDGQADCADPDCVSDPACQTAAEICANGLDDDGDGQTDCADADCADDPDCQPGIENCANATDDDGDGQIDCDDADCAQAGICQPGVEHCANGADDDDDGAIDCADSDCALATHCQVTAEICDNSADDDGDGAIDCADPNCIGDTACEGWEDCQNGFDDDGDGVADCEDVDCVTAPNCASTKSGLTQGGCQCAQSAPAGNQPLPLPLLFAGLWLAAVWRRRRRRAG